METGATHNISSQVARIDRRMEIGGHTKTQIHKLAVPTAKLMTTKKPKDVNLAKKTGQA